jgi:hypothetical protein
VRSLLVVVFVCIAAGIVGFVAQQPTVARGSVLAAGLLQANGKLVRSITCDDEVLIGLDGATFRCMVVGKEGGAERDEFHLDRSGMIRRLGTATNQTPGHEHHAHAKEPVDPWD